MKIRTRYYSNPTTGAGRISATGCGHTVTIPYPHHLSGEEKHWAAVAAWIEKHGDQGVEYGSEEIDPPRGSNGRAWTLTAHPKAEYRPPMNAVEQLRAATTVQVVACWNVLQWQLRAGIDRLPDLETIRAELVRRNIRPKAGKLLTATQA